MPVATEESVSEVEAYQLEGESLEALFTMSEGVASTVPDVKGYRILVAMPDVSEQYGDSGIVKTQEAVETEGTSTIVGYVVRMGDDAYIDTERFPNGPWCKVGDFVVFKRYSGTRIAIHGTKFRIINDDTVEAVVRDPRGVAGY